MPTPIQRLVTVGNVAANTSVELLSAAANYFYLCAVSACNRGTTAASIKIWVKPSQAANNNDSSMSFYAYDVVLGPSDVWESIRFSVNPGDILYARATTSNVGFTVNGLDQLYEMLNR